MTPDLATLMPQPPRCQRRWATVLSAAAVLAVAGVIVGYLGMASARRLADDRSGPTATPTPLPLTVHGELIFGSLGPKYPVGAMCRGYGGFKDIGEGAPVTITDASGKVVGVGTLPNGVAEVSRDLPQVQDCVMRFEVAGVPRGAGPYGVEVSHRGVVRFDEASLVGIVTLTLDK